MTFIKIINLILIYIDLLSDTINIMESNKIENIKISNITVFKYADINVSKGLNVFIGKNGTGKTHLLKIINCLDNNFYNIDEVIDINSFDFNFDIDLDNDEIKTIKINKIDEKLSPFGQDAFKLLKMDLDNEDLDNEDLDNIESNTLKDLLDMIFDNEKAKKFFNDTECFFNKYFYIKINDTINLKIKNLFLKPKKNINNYNLFLSLENNDNYLFQNKKFTFIPCKDMLSYSNGFTALYDKRDVNFEPIYYNILKKAELPKLRSLDKKLENIAMDIENAIGGKTVYKNNSFFIKYNHIGEVSFDMVAEGHKKLALLYTLIMNGEIDENTILLVDEPESNLNPQLTDLLVKILLDLSRLGCQIFIATHNDFILNDIELQRKKDDEIMFHSFYFDDDNIKDGVKVESNEILSNLSYNPIEAKIIKQHNESIDKMFE
ncbi:ATP-binding protein [Brachyspira suanatina]|uniref:ATP-binding protein n=1 Tax=Brachyspira suanatina TaxID=381802 RepID=A0A0G4K432_9SPIR|nr:ATP-binding protein [Brachyspira suanatina]CRF31699.1 ATP-binding protein [Brachyspira suanatina]